LAGYGPTSPVFDHLLNLNPWARPSWVARQDLIARAAWNINHINQAGNAETRAWLETFEAARSAASLALISGEDEAFEDWTRETMEIVYPLFDDPAFAQARPGVPLTPMGSGGLVNTDAEITEYGIAQFKADVLLLAQLSLVKQEVHEPVHLDGLTLPLGIIIRGSAFHGPVSTIEARFGPYTDISSRFLNDVDMAGAEFVNGVHMTVSGFKAAARFERTRFRGPSGFDAVGFDGPTSFAKAIFEGSVQFAGTSFATSPDFSDAQFQDRATFEQAQFAEGAALDRARFAGPVATNGIKPAVRRLIEAAQNT
jgi:hypothetical protein